MGFTYRDAGTTAKVAEGLLYAVAAVGVATAGAAWARNFDVNSIVAPELMLGLLQFLLYLLAAIASLRWTYLAHANARALGATDMMASPALAVIYFFIPLVNLVMPVIMMRELWKASINPKDWQAESASPIVPLWWAFWIAGGIASAIGFSMAMSGDKEVADTSEMMFFFGDLLSVPALLLLAIIIGRIQALQTRGGAATAELQDRFA